MNIKVSFKIFFSNVFYTIFFICFALASILNLVDFHRRILFIISILLGFMHLFFEIKQCLWDWKIYIKDLVNLFGK